MNFIESSSFAEESVLIENRLPAMGRHRVITTLLDGLTSSPRRISSMFFYDATGSKLFEEITRLPEYYPTRIEKRLLPRLAGGLRARLTDGDTIELGSGDCSKISILFDSLSVRELPSVSYVPVDVSQEAIEESASILSARYPGIRIRGLVADFMTQLHLVPNRRHRLFCFFGGTIGNLDRGKRKQFFQNLAASMHSEDLLILGVDMVKPRRILERAYNDDRNVTAAFNRNILNVVNSLAGTNFDPVAFDHVAFFNENDSRIEMHLRARYDVRVHCPHLPEPIQLSRGELIHTENSHKFTAGQITAETGAAGLRVEERSTDPQGWFSLVTLTGKAGNCL